MTRDLFQRRALLGVGASVATAAVTSAATGAQTDGPSAPERSLLEFVPPAERPRIAAGVSRWDCAGAIAAADAAGAALIVPPGVFRLASDCRLGVPVRFLGGVLETADGVTAHLDGPISAPPAEIFRNAAGGHGRVRINPSATDVGRAEWWGARTNDAACDCQPALQAAVDACAIVQLLPGDYHLRATVRIQANGVVLRGASATQTDQGPHANATVLVVDHGAATGVQIGADAAAQPAALTEYVRLEDLTVRRAATILNPATGVVPAPTGVALRWCVNCHLTRVETLEHSIGFLLFGVVESYLRNCSALRSAEGARPENDAFVGFYLDYAAPLAANGGIASLYLDHCRAFGSFGGATPRLSYSAGLRSDDGFVDVFITALETGLLQFGIDLNGRAYDSGRGYRTEDLIIDRCVLDTCALAGVRLRTGDISTAATISNCYIAPGQDGAAVVLENLGGSVSLTGNQYIAASGGAGLRAANVNGLSSINNIYTAPLRPIALDGVTNFRLVDTIHLLSGANPNPAISLANCAGGKIDTIVNGPTGCCAAGVSFQGLANRAVEVACTAIQASAPAGGPTGKLVWNGAPVASPGPFGAGCLAQGLMA